MVSDRKGISCVHIRVSDRKRIWCVVFGLVQYHWRLRVPHFIPKFRLQYSDKKSIVNFVVFLVPSPVKCSFLAQVTISHLEIEESMVVSTP